MTINGGNILVVDDSADWREMMGGVLAEAGYYVQTASDPDEAMRLLRQQPYHVAVVDLRLDERDENNEEGLILAERMKEYLPELAIIMLTGHANIPAVKQALQPRESGSRIAFDFLEKHEIPRLLPSINIAFTKAARVNPHLLIKLDPALSWAKLHNTVECLQALDAAIAKSELQDLLQRIFFEAQMILVKLVNGGRNSGSVVSVTPTVRGVLQTDVVVKFNEREKAERESRNYDSYVANYVGGARRTQRLDFRATARLGGIAYSFVGAETIGFQRFSHAYADNDTADIKDILDNLFKETCYTWYTKTLQVNNFPHSLSAGYKEWLRLDTSKLEAVLKEITKRAGTAQLTLSNSSHLTQADMYLKERGVKLVNPLLLSQAAFAYSGPFCFTHGDLHEGNILVDTHNQTWLIDFYQTGLGHPVRDFAMLESAIKFSLQQSDCSLGILYDWERMLLHVNSLTDLPNSAPPLQLDAELTKATELIRHIRTLLSQIVPDMGLRDYQISLYFHALKAMTLLRKFTEQQRLHALISASLMAELLQ